MAEHLIYDIGRVECEADKKNGENRRMTETEREREAERLRKKSRKEVKVLPDEQRIIRIVRFANGVLASYIGTIEETLAKARQMECLYGKILHIE